MKFEMNQSHSLTTKFHMYMGIWSHERYISVESELGSLQSTDALSGHVISVCY